MSVLAYVLIKVKSGAVEKVVKALVKLPETKDVHMVTGVYDIIATITVADLQKLGETVAEKIHDLPGVSSTVTCIVVG